MCSGFPIFILLEKRDCFFFPPTLKFWIYFYSSIWKNTLSKRIKRTKKENSVAGNLFSVCIVNFTQDEMVEKYMGLAHYGFHLEKSRRKKY
jgi:hypothetical protein